MHALETLRGFAPAYLATLAMALACTYLGMFTVLRRIVFTGAALAQLAAAGVAMSVFLADAGWSPLAGRLGASIGGLTFALLGALGLQARPTQKRLTPDALVGLTYAGSLALTVLLLAGSARGPAELKNLLAGEVLFSTHGELLALWMGLLAVAVVHASWRREFLLVSFDPEFARSLGMPERRYQLLLLGSLAVAVALSLEVAGLLLVFAFLVMPPVAGLVLGRGLGESTLLALGVAMGSTLVGFFVAIAADLPVAATIAAAQLVLLALAGAGRVHEGTARAARGLVAGLAVAALAAVPWVLSGSPVEPRTSSSGPSASAPGLIATTSHPGHPDPPLEETLDEARRTLETSDQADARRAAAERLGRVADPRALPSLCAALVDVDPRVIDAADAAIAKVAAEPAGRAALDAMLASPDDADARVGAARALLHMGDLRGVEAHIRALGDDAVPPFVRARLLEVLLPLAGGDAHGFDPMADPATNAAAIAAWQAWWAGARARMRWDPARRSFRVE